MSASPDDDPEQIEAVKDLILDQLADRIASGISPLEAAQTMFGAPGR
ncbi:hypothetical protein OG339_48650 (plasmid) [Streptosporangium sp. NBC_01495]|nr:hypothetical protein [Streptosporangium sp. NBC_01495]